MRNSNYRKFWIPAFLLAAATAIMVVGCGDSDKAGSATSPLAAPTVVSVVPVGAATGICQGAIVTATFSKAMNPATINTGTFKLANGTTAVTGTVALDSASLVATFSPSSPLALNTSYTATITTGAQDTFGNGLAADFPWMFKTAASACAGPLALGNACSFGILAGSTVTNTGLTNVSGNVGVSPGTAITGFPPGTLSGGGTLHSADATAANGQADLTTAYNNAAAAAAGGAVLTADIGGQTLAPGTYRTTSAQPSLGITGNLTLDGGGDPNASWIISIVSTLTTASTNSQIILINGASAHNVFWQVGSSATLGTSTTFAGTIMAQASITLNTGATLNGRALARTGAVSLAGNQVNVPPCP